jgi:hypothetical protein
VTIYFPARGDSTTPRTTNTPRIDRRGIFFPKIVTRWWWPLTEKLPNRERKSQP